VFSKRGEPSLYGHDAEPDACSEAAVGQRTKSSMVLRYIQGLVDVTWQLLLALQEVDQLENAFVIDATMAKHHFTVDARVAPTQAQVSSGVNKRRLRFSSLGEKCSRRHNE